jgi:hypothetical protein
MRGLFPVWGSGGFSVLLAAATAAAALGGCGSTGGSSSGLNPNGSGGAGGSGPVQPTDGPYEPLAVGVSWTYHVNDSGQIYDKTSTVEATEDAGGAFAGVSVFRVHDVFPTETQNTWYQVDGLVVKRLHDNAIDSSGIMKTEDWYNPYRLRVDETPEHLVAGATWTSTFTDSQTSRSKPPASPNKTDTWRVEGVDETVTVPLGTFHSLHVTRTDSSDGSTKSFWFVRGIGKVKESTSGGHNEELSSRTP